MKLVNSSRLGSGRAIRAIVAGLAIVTIIGTGPVAAHAATSASGPTCTRTFNDTAGGSFFNASKWNDAGTTGHDVPGPTDFACIPNTVTGAVTFSTGSSATILGIKASGAGFSLGSGTLSLTDTSNASTFHALTAASGATISGPAGLALTGASSWSGANLNGTGTATINAGATVTVTQPSNLNRNLVNNGTLTVSAGQKINIDTSTATLTNNKTIVLNGDGAAITHDSGYTPGTLTNNATISHPVGTLAGSATVNVPLTSSLAGLSLTSGTGTFALGYSGTLTGTGTVPTNTTLAIAGTGFTLNGTTFNGTGLTLLNPTPSGYPADTLAGTNTINTPLSLQASLSGAGDVVLTNATTSWSGANLSGTGTATINAGATVTVTQPSNLNRNLVNNGTLTVSAGQKINIDTSTATLTNNKTIVLNGDGAAITHDSGYTPGTLTNNATISHPVGTLAGSATVNVPLTSSLAGLSLTSGTGTFALGYSGTLTGTGTVPTNTTLAIAGTGFTLNGTTFNGTGLTLLNPTPSGYPADTLAGTNTINTPLSLQASLSGAGDVVLTNATTSWSRANLSGTGTATINAGATVTVTQPSNLNRNLVNNGTLTVSAGQKINIDTSTATLTNNKTIVLNGDGAAITHDSGYTPGTLTNNATISRGAGTAAVALQINIVNKAAGVVNLGTGPMTVGTLTNSGTVNIGLQALTVTVGMHSNPTGILNVSASSTTVHGSIAVSGTNALRGELVITAVSGYTPAVNDAIQFVTTSTSAGSSQKGNFAAGSYQLINSNTGWKFLSGGSKVIAKLRPASETAAGINAPALATHSLTFNVEISVTNNGPMTANKATATLTIPAGIVFGASLPTGCIKASTTTVRCTAATLATGASPSTWDIPVTGTSAGIRQFAVAVTNSNTDIVSTNNKVSATTTVV